MQPAMESCQKKNGFCVCVFFKYVGNCQDFYFYFYINNPNSA